MASSSSRVQVIVFDFGGVLLDWDPRYLYRTFFEDDPEAVERFLDEIAFFEWNVEQDRGRPLAEAVVELAGRFPHHAERIRAYETRWEESIAGAIEGTVRLLRALKQAGYPLYGLSNWSAETFRRIRPRYAFFDAFDGIVLSGEVRLVKPDPRIYEVLLERIGRPAEACLFIDDSAANVEAAKQLGFDTVRFESPAHLAEALYRRGLLARDGVSGGHAAG